MPVKKFIIKKSEVINLKYNRNYTGRDFAIGSILVFLWLLVTVKEEPLFYDESSYVYLGTIFATEGILDFKAFGLVNNFIRGYLFPWIIAIFKLCPNHSIFWWIITSMMVSGICTVAIPYIFENFGFERMKTIGKSFIIVLFCVFYSGTIKHILSDMWGAGFMLFGICFLIFANNIHNSSSKMIIFSILSGILTAGAYNIRTIYLGYLEYLYY